MQINEQNARSRRSVDSMMQHLVSSGVLRPYVLEPAHPSMNESQVVLIHSLNQTHRVSRDFSHSVNISMQVVQ